MSEQQQESNPPPATPSGFDKRARALGVDRGWEWIPAGWKLFMSAPGLWVVCTLIFFCVYFVVSWFPIIGRVAGNLIAPILTAGLMFACGEIRAGRPLQVAHLFEGFRRDTGPLVITGLVYAVACLVVSLVTMLMIGAAIGTTALAGILTNNDPWQIVAIIGSASIGLLLALLVSMALSIPIAMAIWFAPALVFLDKLTPMDALAASFDASLRNMLPFLLYGVVMTVLFIAGSIPLGIGLLVVIPLLVTSTYAAYREIFHGDK
ncbi:MAG: DUF2189 domain-containing protein [Betaproteobacteria bacterium]|nr:DUF2189 domain-containing protein [Betaproteobacteria bacterium]